MIDIQTLVKVSESFPKIVPKLEGEQFNGWGHGACRRARGFGFYRQAVQNKHSGEVKYFFVSIPSLICGEVELGRTIELSGEGIPENATNEEVETMARESFQKLQDMVVDFYNREAA